jgi:hypothetical protein
LRAVALQADYLGFLPGKFPGEGGPTPAVILALGFIFDPPTPPPAAPGAAEPVAEAVAVAAAILAFVDALGGDRWKNIKSTVTLSTEPRFRVASVASSLAISCTSTFLLTLLRTKFTACWGFITSHNPSVAMTQNSVCGVHTSEYTSGTAITGPEDRPDLLFSLLPLCATSRFT